MTAGSQGQGQGQEEALLADVIAAPDDDAPRLVYADFLQERGRPEDALRGELIVVQCERERLEREEKTTTLEYRRARWREEELLARLEGDYRRGFLHRWTLSTRDALCAIAEAPWAPLLETIVLRGDGALTFDARRLLALELPSEEPLWAPERGLPHPRLVPALLAARFTAPTEQTIRDLIEHDAPGLRHVTCVNGLRFTDHAFEAYAKTPSFAKLDRLALWRIEESEAYHFIEHAPPEASALTIVADDDVRTPLAMSSSFRRCPALSHVRELHVSVAYELEDVALLVRDAPHLERWTAPDGLSADAREAVAKGPLTERLRHLELSFGGYPDVADLVTAPWARLQSLALGNATIGPELAKAPALESLVELRLFGCQIAGDVEAAIRARWPRVRIE